MEVEQGKTLEQLAADGWKEAPDPKAPPASPAEAAAAGHPEARMSAAAPVGGRPDLALPPAMVDDLGQRKLVSPEVSSFMATPIARPTGVDAVDSFLSPSSLAMMAFTGGPKAVKAVSTAVADLTEAAGGALTKKVLKFVTPSLLKKPGELADILNEIGKAVKAKGEAAPVAPPSPAAAVPAPAEPVAAPMSAQPIAAGSQPSSVGKAMNDLLQLAKEAKSAGKPTLRTSEQVNEAFKLVVSGMTPAEAFGQVTQPAAAGFANAFGLPNDAAMKAQIASRQYKQ